MSTLDRDPPRALVLEAGRADRQYWIDLWRYRELFLILAWRDVAVRYKQTVIGVVWAFVRPFMTMVVFTVVFGRLAKLPTEALDENGAVIAKAAPRKRPVRAAGAKKSAVSTEDV